MQTKASADPPKYPDHSKLFEVRDAAGNSRPVQTEEDWLKRREHILENAQVAMGKLPGDQERCPLRMQIERIIHEKQYIRYKLTYQGDSNDKVPAHLLVPNNLRARAPALLCLHQTQPAGKDEPTGLTGKPSLHYAKELAERGFVCLVPDYPSFGEYVYDFAKDRYISGTMKAIWNNIRAVDLLVRLPTVDPNNIGTIGHSLGGHNSIFTAVFDQRIKLTISCCGFTAAGRYYGGNLKGWTSDRYMPKIAEYPSWRDIPFDFHELIAAIAPRWFLTVSPTRDANFDLTGVKEVIEAAGAVYKFLKVPDHLIARYPEAEHDFPEADRIFAYELCSRVLRPNDH